MALNDFAVALLNKFLSPIINDQFQNYEGIYGFSVRPAQMQGDSIELTNLDIITPTDYDIADTNEFATGPLANTTTIAPVNYKKIFETTVSVDNLNSAILNGGVGGFIALISKRLFDSLVVNKETFLDTQMDTFFVTNPTFRKTITNFTAGIDPRNTELAMTDIITLASSASKPNTDNLLGTTGVLPVGSPYLLIKSTVWGKISVDLRAKLFHTGPAVQEPFAGIRIINDDAIPGNAQAFGYLVHEKFVYTIDRLNSVRTRPNTQNLVDYTKLHHWSRLGIDGGFIGYQLQETV